MRYNIEQLLESNISNYRIYKETGINQSTLSDLKNGKTSLDSMKLINAEKLNLFYLENEEEIKMQNTVKDLNLKEGTFVTYYYNVGELLADGMDKEVLDEKHYVFGNKDMSPSEIEGPIAVVEVEGADDTPIFLEGQEDELKRYFE